MKIENFSKLQYEGKELNINGIRCLIETDDTAESVWVYPDGDPNRIPNVLRLKIDWKSLECEIKACVIGEGTNGRILATVLIPTEKLKSMKAFRNWVEIVTERFFSDLKIKI